jgi:hypothetical protein
MSGPEKGEGGGRRARKRRQLGPVGSFPACFPPSGRPPSPFSAVLIRRKPDVVDENPVGVLGRTEAVSVRARVQGIDLALDERHRRRTRRQCPESKMLQDFADGLWGVDEGDDLQAAPAVGADQGIDLVNFLN